jgi:hypothetical protein
MQIELIIAQREDQRKQILQYTQLISRLFTSTTESQVSWESALMSLAEIYYYPKHTAGFVSVTKLVKASKKKRRDVEEWFSGQDAYTLNSQYGRVSLEIRKL